MTNSKGEKRSSIIGIGGKFDNRTKTSIDGICFLLIHTYLSRKSMQENGESIAIPGVEKRHLQFLRTLFNSKAKEASGWQEELFGDNPFYEPEHFLERKGSPRTGTAEPYILQSVSVDIQPATPLTSYTSDKLQELAENLAAGEISNPFKLDVSIKGDEFEIRSSYLKGSLSRNDRLQVKIDWNFRTYLYIYWISSENSVFPLYPKDTLKVGAPKITENNQAERSLIIPRIRQFQIKTKPGHETCLIFCSETSLEIEAQDELEKTITEVSKRHDDGTVLGPPDNERPSQGRDGSVTLDAPEYREFTASKKKKKLLRRRFGAVEKPEGWENQLVSNIGHLVQKVYFFHIPNQP